MNGKLLTGENAIKLFYSEKSKRVQSNQYESKEYGCFRTQIYDDIIEIDF